MPENPYKSPDESQHPAGGRAKLLSPATTLLVVSVLWIFFCLFGMVFFHFAGPAETTNFYTYVLAIDVLYSAVLVSGAFSMVRRGSYMWAVTTNILAMVPILGPFYFLGLPIGIWALVVLRNQEVRNSFARA